MYGILLELIDKIMKTLFFLYGFIVFLNTINCQTSLYSKQISKVIVLDNEDANKNSVSPCDTFYYEDYLSIINENEITNVEKLVLDPLALDTLMINGQVRVLNRVEIFDGLQFCYYTNTDSKPNDDYEYFLFGNLKIYIDLFYYKMIEENYAFRSRDLPSVYKFQEGSYDYYAVFLNNFSCGIAHGNTLFLFSYNTTTKENQLVFYSLNQVASDISCFGYDENNSTILYYDWDYVNTVLYNKKSLTIYQLSNGKLSYNETKELNITVLNNWMMIFCNK